MWITVIEWDGKQPPTQYYTRLAKLGLKVRGNKDEPPISRRKSESDPAVIAQEGAILTATESLANVVADYARTYGARSVHVGEVNFKDFSSMYDEEVFNRIESVLGARGRRPVYDEDSWSITCLDCVRGFRVQSKVFPVQCSNCSGVKVQVRQGAVKVYQIPPIRDQDDLVEFWVASRFAGGDFEIPILSPNSSNTPPEDVAAPDEVKEVVDRIKPDVLKFLGTLSAPTEDRLRLLDGILVGVMDRTPEQMVSHRVKLANVAAQRGYSMEEFPIIMGDELDLMDSVAIGTAEFKQLSDQYHQIITKQKGDIK